MLGWVMVRSATSILPPADCAFSSKFSPIFSCRDIGSKEKDVAASVLPFASGSRMYDGYIAYDSL